MIRRSIYMVLAFLMGCLLLLVIAADAIGWAGAGHNSKPMPGRELFAPFDLYPLGWPILFPLSLSRRVLWRRIVRYLVCGQVFLVIVGLFQTGGLNRIQEQMRQDPSEVATLAIVVYLFSTLFLLIATSVPRRTVGLREGEKPM